MTADDIEHDVIARMATVDGASFPVDIGGRIVYSRSFGDGCDLAVDGERLTTSDRRVHSAVWLADRERLLAHVHDGGTAFDIADVDTETGNLTPIINDDGMNVLPRGRPDHPNRIAFVAASAGMNVVEYDTETGERTQLTHSDRPVTGFDYAPAGDRIVYHTGIRGDLNVYITAADGAEERSPLLAGEDCEDAITEMFFSPDGTVWHETGILVASNRSGHRDIGIAQPDGSVEWVVESDRDKGPLAWRPDGEAFAYLVSGPTGNHPYVWENGETRRLTDAGAFHREKSGFTWTQDGQPLYALQSHASAGDIYIGDEVARSVGHIDDDGLIAPQPISYTSFDGREIPAMLYEPVESNGTAVIEAHGGPEVRAQEGIRWRNQLLAQRGYTVLVPNFRGSTGFGREFRKLSDGDLGGDDLRDIVAGAEWLRDDGAASVGIFGVSYGGYMALMAIATTDAFDAAASISGVTDLETAVQNARGPTAKYLMRKIGGTPEERPEFYTARSPLTHADDISNPVFLVSGELDKQVPPEQAERIAATLDDRDVPHEHLHYEEEGHVIGETDNQIEVATRLTDFLDRHL